MAGDGVGGLEKLHNRIPPLLSCDRGDDGDDDDDNITVFLTTFDMIEQLLNDAEFFTFGDAVILIGTVQVALNEADLCTGFIISGLVVLAVVTVADVVIPVVAVLLVNPVIIGGEGEGPEEDEAKGEIIGFVLNFFGDGVFELSHC